MKLKSLDKRFFHPTKIQRQKMIENQEWKCEEMKLWCVYWKPFIKMSPIGLSIRSAWSHIFNWFWLAIVASASNYYSLATMHFSSITFNITPLTHLIVAFNTHTFVFYGYCGQVRGKNGQQNADLWKQIAFVECFCFALK